MDPYTWFKVKSRTVLKPAVQITAQVREDKKSFLAASVNNNRDLNFDLWVAYVNHALETDLKQA